MSEFGLHWFDWFFFTNPCSYVHIYLLHVLFPNSYSLELKVFIYFTESLMKTFVISCFPWNVSCCMLQAETVKFASHQHCLPIFKVCFLVSWLLFCKCVLKQFLKYQEVLFPLTVTFVSFYVPMAVTVKITVFSDVMLCRLVAGYVSEELCWLLLLKSKYAT